MTEPEQHVQIRLLDESFGGVWSNMARVSHSPFEFTIDFARLDYTQQPPVGMVVARVNMSPLMVSQLIEALQTNWESYAERAMPKEVRGYGDQDRGDPAGDDAADHS